MTADDNPWTGFLPRINTEETRIPEWELIRDLAFETFTESLVAQVARSFDRAKERTFLSWSQRLLPTGRHVPFMA